MEPMRWEQRMMAGIRTLLCFILCMASIGHGASILICGVAKNCAFALPSTIRQCEALGSCFDDYRVVIYENNSTDPTASLLATWATRNPNVTLLTEVLSKEQLYGLCRSVDRFRSPCKVELIARGRNIVLDEVAQSHYPTFDYVVVADLDFECPWPIREICEAIQQREWDCITTYGVDEKGRYYDVYALRDEQVPLGPEFLGDGWWPVRLQHRPEMHPSDPWMKVQSAFGGLAIYRAACILPLRYSAGVTEARILEAKNLLSHNLRIKNLFSRLRKTKSLMPIANSTFGPVPVACEHVSLHAEMRARGYDRIFINPQMRLTWKE